MKWGIRRCEGRLTLIWSELLVVIRKLLGSQYAKGEGLIWNIAMEWELNLLYGLSNLLMAKERTIEKLNSFNVK